MDLPDPSVDQERQRTGVRTPDLPGGDRLTYQPTVGRLFLEFSSRASPSRSISLPGPYLALRARRLMKGFVFAPSLLGMRLN